MKALVSLPVVLSSVAGAQELYDWFGYWPDFHDAEVLKFQIEAGAPCVLVLHTWEMTKEINEAGFYKQVKNVVVEFALRGVIGIEVQDPWERSILLSLGIKKSEAGFLVELCAAYGLSGTIETEELSLCVFPGNPPPEPRQSPHL